jgi:hypothetical protein
MSRKAKGLARDNKKGYRNKKGSLSLGSYRAAKNSVFSIFGEKPEARTVKLFDD